MSTKQQALNTLPTFLAYSDELLSTFQILNLTLAQHFVAGAGHKNYVYSQANDGILTTFDPSTYLADRSVPFKHPTLTNNCYWNALNQKNQRRASVGGDIDLGIPGNEPSMWQYVDFEKPPHPGISDKAKCTPAQIYEGVSYPPTLDTGGELRNSVYWIPLNEDGTESFMFNGGVCYFCGDQIVAVIFTVERGSSGSTAKEGNTCTLPVLNYSDACLYWGFRTPAPFTTIPATHAVLPTISGSFSASTGTDAIQFNQVFEVPDGVKMGV
jgi:hypothetical protein